MAVGICTALLWGVVPHWDLRKEGRKARSGAEKSNPTNLRRVFGDDKDAQIVRPGIGGDQEKSVFLRIVSVRSSHQLFAVAKGNLGFAALILRVKFLRFAVFAIANEIPGKEDGFQVLQVDFRTFALGGVLLEKKAEVILLRRKIVEVTLHTAAIEEGDYCPVPVTKSVWSRHRDSLVLSCSGKDLASSGKVIRDTSARPISPLEPTPEMRSAVAARGRNLFRLMLRLFGMVAWGEVGSHRSAVLRYPKGHQ